METIEQRGQRLARLWILIAVCYLIVGVSFGIGNTSEEVDAFLGALAREVAELRRAVA